MGSGCPQHREHRTTHLALYGTWLEVLSVERADGDTIIRRALSPKECSDASREFAAMWRSAGGCDCAFVPLPS